ncbi:MAG: hypothetical protein BWY74_01221 [Firmicutes bacterium ADurb.Bin419]|nr:MAG: hypothetical protein BWY74_01221 [Firmicutes bacterium ADurb.Bin419]
MNYVRDILINLRQIGIEEKYLKFLAAKSYSPYMEISDSCINFVKIEEEIEVNPYYRYYEIFKDLFNINNTEDIELRETLFDIVMHFIADIDAMSGMTKREYYLSFIIDDILKGILGDRIKKSFQVFDTKEKLIIAENLIKMYKTGQTLYLLKDTVRNIFKNTTIYANYDVKNEFIFYIPYAMSELNEAKIEFIKEFFLPIKFRTEIYWEDHFGVIEAEETMRIDSIAIY